MNFVQILSSRLNITLSERIGNAMSVAAGTLPNSDEDVQNVIERTHETSSPGVIELIDGAAFVDGKLRLRINESGEYTNQLVIAQGGDPMQFTDGIVVELDVANNSVTVI